MERRKRVNAEGRTLEEEFTHRGLIRPSQLKKKDRKDQEHYEAELFRWGNTVLRGFKKKN